MTTPSARTPEQTHIALFWVESSPLGWNRIARIVAADRGLGQWKTARLLALLNLALADGYIANFDTKHYYNRWRPITAIREAATDGNPGTAADPAWTSLAPTPPGPEYDSGHALEGGAAAEVMQRFFRRDHIAFTTCSTTLTAGSNCSDPNPITRSFTSFSQAAEENALSRILVGYHFRNAINRGLRHGTRIGHHTFVHFLRTLR
ncbi:MAG: vanadium-dependent haloperoxidase [Bryobacteraceae bacterium]